MAPLAGTVFYLDASALVKRYVTEPGSARVMALCQLSMGNTITTARISQAEAAAALILNDLLIQAQFPPAVLVVADNNLLSAAQNEGLLTENPTL